MNNLVVRYRIITDRGSGFVNGNYINVYWDDVSSVIIVYKYTDESDAVGSIITSGPDLGSLRTDHNIVSGYSNEAGGSNYKFCDGTTLNTFVRKSTFPYAQKNVIANHFSCANAVCDIRIIGAETTNSTDETTADGAITVTADSSNPPIRYSLLSDFSDGGQLSNQLNGVLAGTYTVYVKDARGCSSSVDVVVGTPTGYAAKYRLEYYDANGFKSRTDILGRGYSGEIIDVCGDGDPVIIKYNGDGNLNRFEPVIASELRLTLMSPSNFYFRELFSQDERKWKIEHYKDFGVITPAINYLPPLNTFVNGSGSNPSWSLGSTPSVTLTPSNALSKALSIPSPVNFPVGALPITYDIDVTISQSILILHVYDDDGITGEVILNLPVGSNTGVVNMNISRPSNDFDVFVSRDVEQLAPISEWTETPIVNRTIWTDGTGTKITSLNGGIDGFKISRELYDLHNFIEGRYYTVSVSISRVNLVGNANATVQFYGRNEALSTILFPYPVPIISGVATITFVAPAGMTRISFSLKANNTNSSQYTVSSAQITATSALNTTVTINELSSMTEEVDGFKLKWTGFVISTNYSEPYTSDPYPVTVVATDGLADLKKKDFTDRYGNRFTTDIVTINAISEILNKTDLGLNIITAVNRLEENMTYDPLAESKFNPDTFYDSDSGDITNCFEALQAIIKTFAARLFQRDGKWIIMTVEEAVHEFKARELFATGTFIQDILIQDIMPITGTTVNEEAAFTYRDQVLEVVPSYGVLSFEHTLVENPSLVKSYSFEEIDVVITPDGVTTFKNWNINIGNAAGSQYGIKKTRSFDGDYNFFWEVPPLESYGAPGKTLTITSSQGFIEYDANDLIEFRFDYSIITGAIVNNPYSAKPHYPFWVRLKYSLKIGDYFFDDVTGEWTTTKQYNDIYAEEFNDPQNFKLVLPPRQVTSLTTEIFQVEFVLYDNNVFDFTITGSDYSQIDSISTVNLNIGYRIKGKVVYTTPRGETVRYMYWQLNDEDSTSDGDNKRRPSDYNSNTNQKVWVLQENSLVRRFDRSAVSFRIESPSPEVPVKFVYLDNVVLRLLPGGTEPPKNITIERVNNLNIKIDYGDTFLLADIDIDNINNSERTYKNFFKLLDGTPTQNWSRTYRAGTGKLLELYSADFLSQYKEPSNKITGSMILKNEITFATLLRELFDSNKLYMLMGMELHDRGYSVRFDMLELKDVVNDDKSDAIDAGFTSGFSLGFRA